MAYTNSPENSTYKTVNMEFTATSWPRSKDTFLARDPAVYNMFFDRNSNENQTRDFVLKKRAGLADSGLSLQMSTPGNVVRGIFQDSNTNYIYWCVEDKIYRYNGTTTTLIGTMAGGVEKVNSVGFCLFLTSTGTRYLMINNGAELWYHDVTTVAMTKVTDADYPGTTQPSMVFLDGYLFVIKTGTGDIYNSDLDDPTSWTAGNYITTEINPDFAIAIAKVKNYLVAFGTDGVEFFYDAANLQGSPLGRNESYYKQVTLYSSICSTGDVIYFIGKQQNKGFALYQLDGNSIKDISNAWVQRYLATTVTGTIADVSVTQNNTIYNVYASGHNFLFLNTGSSFMLVYDIDENMWYKWAFNLSNFMFGACKGITSSDQTIVIFQNQTNFSYLDEGYGQDFEIDFTCYYITEDYNADTFNWKTCHRVGLYCDYPTTSDSSNAQISWSDDDGNTWSTPRNVSVTTNNPYITQLGRFRTRNWKITYADVYPFRMWGLSMDINVGNI